MNTFKKRYCILSLCSMQVCLSALQTVGQTQYGLSRLSIKHREYKGIGYQDGYTTLSMFLSGQSQDIPFGVFIDGRAHVFNDSSLASNLGLGFRLGDQDQTYSFGMNTYYDGRWTRGLESHQLGLGLEILTRHVDFRMNAYKPLIGVFADENVTFKQFKGHHVQLSQHVTYALPMAEAEIGCTLPDPFDQVGLYLGLGGYYLFKQKGLMVSSGDTPGAKVRLQASPNPYITFGADYSYDRLFKSRGNGFVALNIPLGRVYHESSPRKKKTSWALIQGQDPIRQEIIPFYRQTHEFFHQKDTGDLLRFVFVDNSYAGEGQGTFDAPFTSLKEAQQASFEGDIVYVLYGKHDTAYQDSFALKSKQKLIGSAASFDLHGVMIPALTPGQFPRLVAEDTALFAHNAYGIEIRGMHIQSTHLGSALYCSHSNGVFSDNIFEGNGYAPAVIVDQGVKEVMFSSNIFIGGDENLSNGALVAIYGSNAEPRSFLRMHDNTFICERPSNGLMLDQVFHELVVQGNTFTSSDPEGTAIVSRALGESEKQGLHYIHANQVLTGFNHGIDLNVRDQAYIKSEIHQNYFLSPTLTTALNIQGAAECMDVEVLGNHIKAFGEAALISIDSQQSRVSFCDNDVVMLSEANAVVLDHRGDGRVKIDNNRFEYAQRVKQPRPVMDVTLANASLQTFLTLEDNDINTSLVPVACDIKIKDPASESKNILYDITIRNNRFCEVVSEDKFKLETTNPQQLHLNTQEQEKVKERDALLDTRD